MSNILINKSSMLLVIFVLLAFAAGLIFNPIIFGRSGESAAPEKISFENAIGKKAPPFVLEDLNGNKIKLGDYQGKSVVLFFNEGAMCYPGCWNQVASLSKDERLNNDKVVSFSIVADQKSTWEEIIRKAPQMKGAMMLFDTKRAVSAAYDVLSLESSMHPGSYPGHTYVVVDKEGVIRYTLDDPNMGIWNDKLVEIISKL